MKEIFGGNFNERDFWRLIIVILNILMIFFIIYVFICDDILILRNFLVILAEELGLTYRLVKQTLVVLMFIYLIFLDLIYGLYIEYTTYADSKSDKNLKSDKDLNYITFSTLKVSKIRVLSNKVFWVLVAIILICGSVAYVGFIYLYFTNFDYIEVDFMIGLLSITLIISISILFLAKAKFKKKLIENNRNGEFQK